MNVRSGKSSIKLTTICGGSDGGSDQYAENQGSRTGGSVDLSLQKFLTDVPFGVCSRCFLTFYLKFDSYVIGPSPS